METDNKNTIINYNINILLETQELLKSFYELTNDNEIMNIYNNIEEYIKLNCNHHYIEDYIDLTPDKSMKIHYCTNCFKNK